MPLKAKERRAKKQRAYRVQLKLEMIKAYGGKCKFCGEKDPDVLVLDHINDDGHADRKTNGHKGGTNMYAKLRKKDWPQGYLQLLCANCNVRKEMKRRRMPSKSKAQKNFMAAAAHNPEFAKKAGIPVSVAKEFNSADKGKKFKSGGDVANLKKLFKGKDTKAEELKEAKAIKSGKISPEQYAKGEEMEKKMKHGGKVKCMNAGGSADELAQQAVIDARKKGDAAPAPKRYKKGGVTRADGCAQRGKTRGKFV